MLNPASGNHRFFLARGVRLSLGTLVWHNPQLLTLNPNCSFSTWTAVMLRTYFLHLTLSCPDLEMAPAGYRRPTENCSKTRSPFCKRELLINYLGRNDQGHIVFSHDLADVGRGLSICHQTGNITKMADLGNSVFIKF
jgi:hypothetical protein